MFISGGVLYIFCAVKSHSYIMHTGFYLWRRRTVLNHNVIDNQCALLTGEHTLNISVLCDSLVWHAGMKHEKTRKASGKGRKGDNNSHLGVLALRDHTLLRFGLRANALSPETSSAWWVCESKETWWLTQMWDNYKCGTLALSTWLAPVQLQIKKL